MQFFIPPREHFFRPLTHDNRELCALVLRKLHERVHGANADYAEVLNRELVLEVILHALADPALRTMVFENERVVGVEEERSYASDLLRKLKEHGWLEDYRDPIDLRPTLKLSRAGKAFSETFADLDDSRAKTRQRNMRSARKALAAFIATRDADELLDAHEFLGYTRLQHQGMQIASGEEPDNFIAPGELSEFERRTLRDAFTFVGRAQRALTVSFQTQFM